MSEWIRTSEKRPTRVAVYPVVRVLLSGDRIRDYCAWTRVGWFHVHDGIESSIREGSVTHWLELPPLPTDADDGGR